VERTYSDVRNVLFCRFQRPRGLRSWSAAARLLRLRVRIPPGAWVSVSFLSLVCFQVEVSVSGRSLVQRGPTGCGVSECDRKTTVFRRAWPTVGCRAMEKKGYYSGISWGKKHKMPVKIRGRRSVFGPRTNDMFSLYRGLYLRHAWRWLSLENTWRSRDLL
jgi:hypothetical protein